MLSQDVPPFHVAAGNPARVLRKIETAMNPGQTSITGDAAAAKDGTEAAEMPVAGARQ